MFILLHNCTHLTRKQSNAKILQAKLQWYVTEDFQIFRLDLEKAEEPEIKLSRCIGSSKKLREFQKNICSYFIDYAKVFKYVYCNKLWTILKEKCIPDHLTCFLRILYEAQEGTVSTGCGTTDWFQIGKGRLSKL